MATYTVVAVHMDTAAGHEHIASVRTDQGRRYTRVEVVQSLRQGNTWKSSGDGRSAPIRELPCRHCGLTPYIRSDTDHFAPDNLDNLPRF